MLRVKDSAEAQTVAIYSAGAELKGELSLRKNARSVAIFAHNVASSRFDPCDQQIAEKLQQAGIGTLLFDLLSESEAADPRNLFDIHLLAHRLLGATEWLSCRADTGNLALGYFGVNTGAAAAVIAAALDPRVRALVLWGGRLELALYSLSRIRVPTLLLAEAEDRTMLSISRQAYERLACIKRLVNIPGAGHLFGEPHALHEVVRLARGWFELGADMREPEAVRESHDSVHAVRQLYRNQLKRQNPVRIEVNGTAGDLLALSRA